VSEKGGKAEKAKKEGYASKLVKWFTSGVERRITEYEETKRNLEKVMRPSITITLKLPEGFEDLKEEFYSLESDEKFLRDADKLVKSHLRKKRTKKGVKAK